MDCALACISRGRTIRVVCTALSISRSNLLTKKTRSSDWAILRKSPPKADDADQKNVIASVVKDRATYGYRRLWARLKIDGRQINHKRVYRVMRDEGWLLFRQGQKLWTLESMKAHWRLRKATLDGALMGWNCLTTMESASGWHLHWTAATGRS